MNRKKIMVFISVLLLTTLMLFLYFYVKETERLDVKKDIANGIYFVNTEAYLGYFQDEDRVFQIPLILVHKGKSTDIGSLYHSIKLISTDGNEISVDGFSYVVTENNADYSIYNLNVEVNSLEPGIYNIDQIKMSANAKDDFFDVGTVNLEIRTGNNPKDLSRNRTTMAIEYF